MAIGKWSEQCISHLDDLVFEFFDSYFSDKSRDCLLIGGAGFDPRTARIVTRLSKILGSRLNVLLIQEERPSPDAQLLEKADENLREIYSICDQVDVSPVKILADDGAIIGGRNVISKIADIDLSRFTDIVIDLSALSTGISFPLVSYVYNESKNVSWQLNVHIAVVSNPKLDGAIVSSPHDRASEARGFQEVNLFSEATQKTKLWLPIVSGDKQHMLDTIFNQLKPQDTCPILPFPSEDPKKGDNVAYAIFSSIYDEMGGRLENEWELEPQNFLYADERAPLDIYRTIIRIAHERAPVFEAFGGSTIVLSPLGSKIPSIGALMAGLEKGFPVVYVEAIGYNVDWTLAQAIGPEDSKMAHVWLCGDAYHTTDS